MNRPPEDQQVRREITPEAAGCFERNVQPRLHRLQYQCASCVE
jgi:hypothetical protein